MCESPFGSVDVFDLTTGGNVKLFDRGYSPESWFEYQQYAEELPIMPAAGFMKVGEVTTNERCCSDEEFFGSRVYREFLQPRGQRDFMGLLSLRTRLR